MQQLQRRSKVLLLVMNVDAKAMRIADSFALVSQESHDALPGVLSDRASQKKTAKFGCCDHSHLAFHGSLIWSLVV